MEISNKLTDKEKADLGFIKLQGKWYSTYKSLLGVAHMKFGGRFSIETKMLKAEIENTFALCRCTITLLNDNGHKLTYSGYGDATSGNTTANVRASFIRMAETRSICRALRIMTNIGETAKEELQETKK